MRCVKVLFMGRVQGVGFREQTAHKAESLSISGYVRNNSDGSVEAVFMGPDEKVEKIIDYCRNSVKNANVTGFEEKETVCTGDHSFRILH